MNPAAPAAPPASVGHEAALEARLQCLARKWKLEHGGSTKDLTAEFLYQRFSRGSVGRIPEPRIREIIARVLSESLA